MAVSLSDLTCLTVSFVVLLIFFHHLFQTNSNTTPPSCWQHCHLPSDIREQEQRRESLAWVGDCQTQWRSCVHRCCWCEPRCWRPCQYHASPSTRWARPPTSSLAGSSASQQASAAEHTANMDSLNKIPSDYCFPTWLPPWCRMRCTGCPIICQIKLLCDSNMA